MEVSKIKLRYRDRDVLFKKEYSELKIKVAHNWFELFALIAVTFLIALKTISLLEIKILFIEIILSFVAAIAVAFLFSCFRKYQLKITRFDKEHIYKKISKDLIDETKSHND